MPSEAAIAGAESGPLSAEITSLGVALEAHGPGHWRIDLSGMRLFTGLSVIARLLGEDLLEQVRNGVVDVYVQRRIISDLSPDLVSLGVNSINVFALNNALAGASTAPEEFQRQLRTVLGTLQRPRWASLLFAESEDEASALLFPFHAIFEQKEIDYYFLVELDPAARLLRISIEQVHQSRLNLSELRHAVVDDLERRTYLQGLTRMAESVYLGILRECENNRAEYGDSARRNSHFFEQIRRAGLNECEHLTVRWPAESNEQLVRGELRESIDFLKRVLITLEDRAVIERLRADALVEMHSSGRRAFLDLSRRGRCLNVSLQERREAAEIEYYLLRMPELDALSRRETNVFSAYRIFLVHHITGEILAVIKALENMGVVRLHTLFVKYAGVTPADYLEALLSLPEDRFRFSSLQKVEAIDSVEGYFLLSRQYSRIDDCAALELALESQRLGFYEAMQLAAGHLFFREAAAAQAAGERLLVIEDGGYLMPLLNDMALRGLSLRDAMKQFALDPESLWAEYALPSAGLSGRLFEWLAQVAPGSVEHTRNGFNRLESVEQEHGTLALPALSIAISNFKRERESEEVSISILHAIESILHGIGLVFSQRRALVLGSRGAIGSNLMADLAAKLGDHSVAGVDIAIAPSTEGDRSTPWAEFSSIDRVPEELLREVDVVVGVVGQSILKEENLERLVSRSKRPGIFFASGSTKTAEFSDLSRWIERMQREKHARIDGRGVVLSQELVRDPQTAHIVGRRVRFAFEDGAERSLYLLGGLTPINFLFYGVPTETMDPILAQLLKAAVGVVRSESGEALPPRLLAVDRDIDVEGRLLPVIVKSV